MLRSNGVEGHWNTTILPNKGLSTHSYLPHPSLDNGLLFSAHKFLLFSLSYWRHALPFTMPKQKALIVSEKVDLKNLDEGMCETDIVVKFVFFTVLCLQ